MIKLIFSTVLTINGLLVCKFLLTLCQVTVSLEEENIISKGLSKKEIVFYSIVFVSNRKTLSTN